MKKRLALLVVLVMTMSILTIPVNAAVPVDNSNILYASNYTAGEPVDVQMPAEIVARLNPANALGMYDAVQSEGTSANEHFYATAASHTWTNYTFEDDFCNVDENPDISFCEVTWGTGWHAEAVKVYLTGAYVLNRKGDAVPYTMDDSGIGINGMEPTYYAGIAWNKVGINGLSQSARNDVARSYLPPGVSRIFESNIFNQDGNFGWTRFYLPNEVVYATGITLVDITGEVYTMAGNPSSYINNTDGYDLDAISVFRYIPWRTNDTATGKGLPILKKGTWFMYNIFTGNNQTYPIQAGNPKGGVNIIGSYTIIKNVDGTYTATYHIDDTIEINGYRYDVVVTDEQLGIDKDTTVMNFKAKPGQDDNEDFGVPFVDTDGKFYVFAHFAVEYK